MGEGRYTVFEGLDGVGKGTVIGAVRDYLISEEKYIMDLEGKEFERDFENDQVMKNRLVLLLSEPTHSRVGAAIRKELTARNGRDYDPMEVAHAYALDRHMLLRSVILPAVAQGVDVLSSRNFVSSLCYQTLGEMKKGSLPADDALYRSIVAESVRKKILSIDGNSYALRHPPDLVIISTIRNIDDLMARLAARKKQDDCKFENPEFQRELKPLYEDSSLRNILEEAGSKVAYLDAGISVESSREQAVEIYRDFYEKDGLIQPRYQNP